MFRMMRLISLLVVVCLITNISGAPQPKFYLVETKEAGGAGGPGRDVWGAGGSGDPAAAEGDDYWVRSRG